MNKRWFLCLVLMIAAACSPQAEDVASIPTSTFLPIPSQQPRFTATPESTRTPIPTFTATPSDTPIPPTITNTPIPTATPTVEGIVQSLQRVNVRTGPGENFDSFDSLAPGTGVLILLQTEDGAWYNVRLGDGTEGWISAKLLYIAPTATPFVPSQPTADMTALFGAQPLPTSILGGGTVTATTIGIVQSATPQGASPTPRQDITPTATQPLVPVVSSVPSVNLATIGLTATALANGAATLTATRTPDTVGTPGRVLTVVPGSTTTGTPPAVPTAAAGASTGRGVDAPDNFNVFAFCDNVPKYGIGAPTALRAGQTIDLWWDWYARTEQQVQDHIDHAQYDIRVNGQPIGNIGSYQTPIRRSGSDFAVSWYIPYGPLAAGTYEMTYVVSWDEAVFDGYKQFGPGTETTFEQETCTFIVR